MKTQVTIPLIFIIILTAILISCDDIAETDIMLDSKEIVGDWNFNKITDSSSIEITGQTIYSMGGLMGTIFDTVTIDTVITIIESNNLTADQNYLNIYEDSTYSLKYNYSEPESTNI